MLLCLQGVAQPSESSFSMSSLIHLRSQAHLQPYVVVGSSITRRPTMPSSGFGWTMAMNAEVTAENRPVWVPPGSAFSRGLDSDTSHEDKGGVQVIVILLDVFTVILSRFPAVRSEEVGA